MSIVLFQYKPDTPVAKLLRHHRIARWIVYPCGFCSLLMLTSLAEGIGLGFSTITFVLLSIGGGGSLLLIVPALFCLPWISEIEEELTEARGGDTGRGAYRASGTKHRVQDDVVGGRHCAAGEAGGEAETIEAG